MWSSVAVGDGGGFGSGGLRLTGPEMEGCGVLVPACVVARGGPRPQHGWRVPCPQATPLGACLTAFILTLFVSTVASRCVRFLCAPCLPFPAPAGSLLFATSGEVWCAGWCMYFVPVHLAGARAPIVHQG